MVYPAVLEHLKFSDMCNVALQLTPRFIDYSTMGF